MHWWNNIHNNWRTYFIHNNHSNLHYYRGYSKRLVCYIKSVSLSTINMVLHKINIVSCNCLRSLFIRNWNLKKHLINKQTACAHCCFTLKCDFWLFFSPTIKKKCYDNKEHFICFYKSFKFIVKCTFAEVTLYCSGLFFRVLVEIDLPINKEHADKKLSCSLHLLANPYGRIK